MFLGNDGITDCDYACNPKNFMQWSCDNYCQGYTFIPSSTTTDYPTSGTGAVDQETETFSWLVLIVFACIGTAITIILFLFCFCKLCKKRVRSFIQERRNQRMKHPTQEVVVTDDGLGYDGAALPLVPPSNTEVKMTDLNRNASDSGISTDTVELVNEVGNESDKDPNHDITRSIDQQLEDTNVHPENIAGTNQLVKVDNTFPNQHVNDICIAIGYTTYHHGKNATPPDLPHS